MLKIIGVIIGLVLLVVLGFVWYGYGKNTPEYLATFIKQNPSKAAIYFVKNDVVLVDKNSDKLMPLASTVKIIIAIEYAQQVASGKIKPTEMVNLTTLEKYYLARTDGGAHPKWLETMTEKSLIKDNEISLEEVAKGMITHSSNANTEYLMDKLSLENINKNLEKLNLEKHQPLYPFVSALLLFQDKTETELLKMSLSDYALEANKIHEKLKNNIGDLKATYKNISISLQKIWSDRLPSATAKEYASIMKKINSKTYFDTAIQINLDIVMEGLINQDVFKHAGMKGGSTSFVLAKALYATTKKEEKMELVYFFNDLGIMESKFLRGAMNEFEKSMLLNEKKREELIKIINE